MIKCIESGSTEYMARGLWREGGVSGWTRMSKTHTQNATRAH